MDSGAPPTPPICVCDCDVLTPAGFAAAQEAVLRTRITLSPARSFHPSQIGHPCDRFQVWRFTRWEEQAPHDWTLQSIFDEGNLHAPDVYRRLEAMGFSVVRESDRPTQWKVGAGAVISGRVDGRLTGYRGTKFPQPVVLEIKTMQAHAWDRIETVDDIVHAPVHYVRGYWHQLQLYLLLEECEHGVIVCKNKATGLLKLVPVVLDYAAAEAIVHRIERLKVLLDELVDPAPIPYDDSICGRCGFLAQCYPPKDYGQGLQLFEDAQLLEDMERRATLQSPARQYDEVDKAIKARLKRLGPFEAAMLGPFLIERTEVAVKAYTVQARTDVRLAISRVDEAPQIAHGAED